MNTHPSRTPRQNGFTLVELLIVVIILAIIAAIALPQLSATTSDAKESALMSNLSRMRSAIDLYFQQHGHYPGSVDATGATCPSSGTAGLGDASSAAQQATAFASHLTMFSNAAGQACSTTDTAFKFGPYIKSAATGANGIPANAVTTSRTVTVVSTGDLNMTSTSTTGGWKYDTVTGKLIVDHSSYDHL